MTTDKPTQEQQLGEIKRILALCNCYLVIRGEFIIMRKVVPKNICVIRTRSIPLLLKTAKAQLPA